MILRLTGAVSPEPSEQSQRTSAKRKRDSEPNEPPAAKKFKGDLSSNPFDTLLAACGFSDPIQPKSHTLQSKTPSPTVSYGSDEDEDEEEDADDDDEAEDQEEEADEQTNDACEDEDSNSTKKTTARRTFKTTLPQMLDYLRIHFPAFTHDKHRFHFYARQRPYHCGKPIQLRYTSGPGKTPAVVFHQPFPAQFVVVRAIYPVDGSPYLSIVGWSEPVVDPIGPDASLEDYRQLPIKSRIANLATPIRCEGNPTRVVAATLELFERFKPTTDTKRAHSAWHDIAVCWSFAAAHRVTLHDVRLALQNEQDTKQYDCKPDGIDSIRHYHRLLRDKLAEQASSDTDDSDSNDE